MVYHIGMLFAIVVLFPHCLAVPQGCKGWLDLVFLVDSSNSMLDLSPFEDPLFAWRSHQTFMKQVVSELPVGRQSRVGLVTYGNAPTLNFHLQQHSTSINVQDAILSASFLGGNTNNAAALRMVQDDTNQLQFRSSTTVRKVVVIFTDGLANLEFAKTEQEAQSLHDRGAEVFVVAVSHEIYYEVLEYMASSPKDKHIINVDGIEDLDERLALILAHRICGVEDPITTEPPPTCLPNCAVCQGDLCMQCMEGFYEKDKKCLACMENRGVCTDSDSCTVCIVGWYWEPLTATCEVCKVKGDLVFVIDSSGSIRDANPLDGSYDNYQILKDFITGIIQRLDVSPDGTRMGAVLFSSQASILSYLDEFIDGDVMTDVIQNMKYNGHETNTAAGLNRMRTEIFVGTRGDRPDVRNVGLVITDGESTVQHNMTQLEGQLARDDDIALFVVGATDQIDVEELKGIASDPDDEHFFESTEIRTLDHVMNSLIKHVCTPAADKPTTAGIGDK